MQLLIILALLLYGGKAGNLLSEVKPVLESLGGEEVKEALKSAEEISEVLSAVQTFAGGMNANQSAQSGGASPLENSSTGYSAPDCSFPLAPIAAIADKEITYSLSKYIATAN